MPLIKTSARLLFLLCILSLPATAQQTKEHWVDSVFNSMSFDEKVGQLFMVRLSNGFTDAETISDVENKIENNKIGGVIYAGQLSLSQARVTRRLQNASRIPLLMGLNS